MKNRPPKPQNSRSCQICGKSERGNILTPAAVLRPSVVAEIRKDFPNWEIDGYICGNDLKRFRTRYLESLLEDEKGEISKLEKEVLTALASYEIVSEDVEPELEQKIGFGDRFADQIAKFGGSWKFIIAFGAILIGWICINTIVILTRPFDPYPFILLNLILSCLAALQAPIIMMSQNRQEAKDRLRSEQDFRINLKAELEIRHLHEKMDHLLKNQWQRLIEIQNIQLEMLQEMQDSANVQNKRMKSNN